MPTFDEDVIVNGVVRSRDGYRTDTNDWEIARNGEHLEIREPEQAGKVWARFNDDRSLQLIGTPRLLVDGAGGNQVIVGNTSTKGLRLRDTGSAVDLESFGVSLYINNTGRETYINPQSGGNVGIGTTNPQSKLHVNGDVRVTGDVILPNADCAEEFDVAGAQLVEPGTVMTLNDDATLSPSRTAYDRCVAGVVSGAGAYRPALVLDKRDDAEGRVPVALVGKVYCKVDASEHPLAVGDLLTTSANVGHAMKAVDHDRAFGAVLGKALAPLAEGVGLVPILVALQ